MAKVFLSKVKAMEKLKWQRATLQVCHKLGYAVVRTFPRNSLSVFISIGKQENVRYSVACKMIEDGLVVPKDQGSIGKFYRDVYVLKEVG